MRYAILTAVLFSCACGGETEQSINAKPEEANTVQLVQPKGQVKGIILDPNSECHKTADCKVGEKCFWEWNTNKDVCAVKADNYAHGCYGDSDCQSGICYAYDGFPGCCTSKDFQCAP